MIVKYVFISMCSFKRLDYLTTHISLSPIRRGFAHGFVNYLKKRCTRLAAASDKVYQLLSHGRWFSPGTPASSTTKTGRHDIAEILLKVALNTTKHIIAYQYFVFVLSGWFGLCCCAIIPCCVKGFKDVQHICPQCHRRVAEYKRHQITPQYQKPWLRSRAY